MSSPQPTIAIVGGGFSGAMVAIGLLRHAPAGPLRILLIERDAQLGRGVAYAQRSFPYLLNVPAGRMSANPGDPAEFLTFARTRIADACGEQFLPRELYGDYLQSLLSQAQSEASPGVRLDVVRDCAMGLQRMTAASAWRIQVAGDRHFNADAVVLALGNPAPASLPCMAAVLDHPAYVADPWNAALHFSRREQVLLIGTGLTAADVINAASSQPTATPVIHALSRHALVPPRQSTFHPDALQGDAQLQLLAAGGSVRGLVRAVRSLSEQVQRDGGDWREVVTAVRGVAPKLWQQLSVTERRRFLRHLRTYWDVHRHRLPPQISQRLLDLHESGRLHFHAGQLLESRPLGSRIEVVWRTRGTGAFQARTFDRVINCTGPDHAVARSGDPLWRSLLTQGWCVADELGLGLRTAAHGALVDATGYTLDSLFYVGPMLRAGHWEATAVHELRGHALSLAQHLLSAEV